MSVTKAQIAVWGLIVGLSVWGVTTLSRLKLPDALEPPDAAATEQQLQAATPAPTVANTGVVLPAAIAEFPFPDDLLAAAADAPSALTPRIADSLAEAPSTLPADLVALDNADEETSADDTTTSMLAIAAVEEPPIPMPARPIVARPQPAMPLADVRTLYVVADMLNVRAAPSTSGAVLQKVAQGFAVAPRQQSAEWVGFLMQDGTTGWMRTDYLSATMPPPVETAATEPIDLMM